MRPQAEREPGSGSRVKPGMTVEVISFKRRAADTLKVVINIDSMVRRGKEGERTISS